MKGTGDMSVQPYTSPFAPPFNPNGGGSGNGPSVPSNSPVPDLQMVWQTAPDVVASQAGKSSGSSSSNGSPADFSTSSVDFGSIQNTLNIMLSASSDIVQAYEALKNQFEGVKDWVFGQQGEVRQEVITNHDGHPSDSWEAFADPLQGEAQQFANGGNGQPGMNDIQAAALQSIGNAMATVGQLIALTQSVATGLADADYNSELPPINVSNQ
jgi:hypothetical protein